MTGCYGANADGEILPAFYIFDSNATLQENFQLKESWVSNMPEVKVKFGCSTTQTIKSYVSVTSSGSMTEDHFYEYINKVIIPLYPMLKAGKVVCDANRRIVNHPIVIKVDTGPGRLGATLINVKRRNTLMKIGVILLLGLPNSISVIQELD